MVEKVGLIIPETAAAKIATGELVRTNGVLRTANNMEIVKHLQIVNLDQPSCWQELGAAVTRVVKEHKTGTIIVVSVVVASAVAVGGYFHFKHKRKKEIEEKYNTWINKSLQNYIDAAGNGNLDVDTIRDCEDALMSIPHMTNKIFISLTHDQILELTTSLKNYTQKLAEAYNCEIDDDTDLCDSNNIIPCFLRNLQVQKEILRMAA